MTFWRGALPSQDNGEHLNITACVDIFIVITVYLLMCFATSDGAQRPLSDLVLPTSTATSTPGQAIKLSVSRSAIRIDNQLVMQLQGSQFAPDDMDSDQHIVALMQALARERMRQLATTVSQVEFASQASHGDVLYLEAAHGLPYGVVQRVVETAAAAGFSHIRLAVYHKERLQP